MKTWDKVFSSAVFRLIAIVLAVVIPLNLLTLVLGNVVIAEVEHQVSIETQNALQLYMNQIDDAMARINTKLNLLARSDADFARLREKEIVDSEEYYRQMQAIVRLSNTLAAALDDNTLIGGTYVYFPEKDYFIRETHAEPQANSLMAYIRESAIPLWEEDLQRWRLVNVGGEPFLTLVIRYRRCYYGAWISLQTLGRTVGLFEEKDNALSAFTDAQGTVYLSSDDSIEYLDINSTGLVLNGSNYVLVKAQSAYSTLNYVQLLSKNQLVNALPVTIRALQVLSVVAVLIIPVIMIAMRRWIIRPVGMLSEAMAKIEQGDVDYRIPKSGVGSEFDRINSHFNHMMDEVSELKINIYEQQLRSEKIRLGFLSRQIQPHFILNALNILYSYEPEEHPLSQKMILCLSKYFRYVVNANEDYAELGLELEHIRNYFEIQQARFLRAFQATVEYDQDVADCLIPPLLVQNFTENAIKHSLMPGRVIDITVRAWREGDRLRICIYDTGAGIPEETLIKIEEFRKTRTFREDLGVGIQNAIDRLDLIYGEEGSLDISRQPPCGTRIEIELPIRKKEVTEDECDFD